MGTRDRRDARGRRLREPRRSHLPRRGRETSRRGRCGLRNNGKDGTEGARRLNAYGTYLHGSLLPKNPWLTDQLILNALRQVDENFELQPLDDTVEGRAFSSVA